jgi:predicted transglutaminase-like cysteine proteinase
MSSLVAIPVRKKIIRPPTRPHFVRLKIITGIFISFVCIAGYDLNKFSELAKLKYGDEAYKNVLELNVLIESLRSANELDKLLKINDFFNQKLRFIDDAELWGQSDYWATPLESIGRQAGDCEDYAVAKYIFLKISGIPNDQLKLTYVRASTVKQDKQSARAHMVLSFYQTPLSEPLILDNLIPEILPASKRRDLYPIFSFNDKGLWVGQNIKQKGESQARLSKWRELLSRIHADGLE